MIYSAFKTILENLITRMIVYVIIGVLVLLLLGFMMGRIIKPRVEKDTLKIEDAEMGDLSEFNGHLDLLPQPMAKEEIE